MDKERDVYLLLTDLIHLHIMRAKFRMQKSEKRSDNEKLYS
jgi:hypothetical protein